MRGGWKVCSLGEIADVGAGNSAPQKKSLFDNGSYPFVRTSDVGKIGFGTISDSVDRLNDHGVSGLRLVPKGSVLLPKSGASTFLNHRVMLDRNSYVSSHLATIKANPVFVLDKYLLYFLSTVKTQNIIQDHKYPSLKLGDIKNLSISFPHLPKQRHIVATLDEAFAEIETAIANTAKNLVNTRELFDSRLNSTFSTAPDSWTTVRLDELCSIKHGFAFKSQYFSKEGEYVLLTPGSFWEQGGFRDQRDKTKYYLGKIPEGFLLEKGDFLIAMTEQAAGLLGSSLIAPESGRYLHNQRLGRVMVHDHVEWHNDFFFHQFNTQAFRNAVQATASGVKVRHTSPKKLGEIRVKIPPDISEQKEIADHLNGLQYEIWQLEEIYGRKRRSLTELKQSLLLKAFSGELTAEAEKDVEEAVA